MDSLPDSVLAHEHLLVKANGAPLLHDVLELHGPIELPGRKGVHPVIYLHRIIVGQQLSSHVADTIWRRVTQTSVDLLSIDNLPSLSSCGVSRNKIKAMVSLVENSTKLMDTIGEGDLHALRHSLVSIWGIGEWTADIFLLFYMKSADVFPMNDTSLIKAWAALTADSTIASCGVELFSPFKSYLALNLWRYADTKK